MMTKSYDVVWPHYEHQWIDLFHNNFSPSGEQPEVHELADEL